MPSLRNKMYFYVITTKVLYVDGVFIPIRVKMLEKITKKNVEMIIYVLLEHQMTPIFDGKNIFIRIHYLLGILLNSRLILKSITLV